MSEYEKSHRPEPQLAERREASPASPGQAPAEEPGGAPARLWRALGVAKPPRTADEAATVAVQQRGSGQAIDPALAASVTAQTGVDVSSARVHTDPLSRTATTAMNARAFAHGNDIFLGHGESETDVELLSHELTHVAQQRGGVAAPQRKVAVGADGSAAEQDADRVAKQVATAAPAQQLIVDSGPLTGGQLLKGTFLDQLKPHVVSAANDELGRLGSALGCPYIAEYFAKYSALPASSTTALLAKWIPASKLARSASDLIPLIVQRVRAGVHTWKETGKLPADLTAAEPSLEAKTPAAPPTAQRKSLEGIEQNLGPGEAADSRLAGAMGAEGARVHRGPTASAMAAEHNAVAFAVGQNVVMGGNAPKPGTMAGDALLAHELAHTAQQKQAATDPAARKKPIGEEDQAAEVDADRAAQERLATLGNFAGRVGDVMKTGVQLQRCANDSGPSGIDRRAYYKQYELQIATDAANLVRDLPFGTKDTSVQWTEGGAKKFAKHLADSIATPTQDQELESLVRPEMITSIIDHSRLMNEEGAAYGPDQYFGAVGIAVGNALARRTDESLAREVPRYAQAKLASGKEPKADDIPVSHPIDPLVVAALTQGNVLSIDHAKFQQMHPDLHGAPKKITSTRNIVLDKVGESGMWYRLKEPMDATVEEIAMRLFSSPTEAFRITNAHPLYGVANDTRGEILTDAAGANPSLVLLKQDPAAAEEAILSQAGGEKPSRPRARILEQMRLNATLLKGTVLEHARRFGPDVSGRIQPAGDRLDERVTRLSSADDAQVEKWDAQTSKQADVIAKAARGLQADLLRLQLYATQFDTNLKDDPGAQKLPHEHRLALHTDAELWCDVLAVSDMVGSAYQRMQIAAQHSATLESEILEQQLNAAQAAAFASKDSKQVKADFDAGTMEARELDMRKRLAQIRAQTLADPTKLDEKQTKETSDATQDLVFEAQIVGNAAGLDQAWRALDDLDGTLSKITGDHDDLDELKREGKGYYAEWIAINTLFKTDKTGARKRFQFLATNRAFQSYLKRVNELLKQVQKNHLIATIIAMVVIMVVSMGAGVVVEGLLGGAAVAGGAAEGAVVVSTGLGVGRTAASIAGFVANVGTMSLLNQVVFAKELTLTGFLAEFARNVVLFGAMRGIAAGFRAAGLEKVAEAGFKADATFSQMVKAGGVRLGELVLNGGVGVLEAIIEAKIREAMGGKGMSQAELEELVKMTVIQTVVMTLVARIAESPLKKLQIKAAFQGEKWKLAVKNLEQELKAVKALEAGKPSAEQVVEAARKDQEQMELEIAAIEELKVRAKENEKVLEGSGVTVKQLDTQITTLRGYQAKAHALELSFGMKEVAPDHYTVPRKQAADVLATHARLGKKPPKLETTDPDTGARTWRIVNEENGTSFRITEEMPDWAITSSGKRLVAASQKAGIDDNVLFNASTSQTQSMLALERAIAEGNAKAIESAKAGLGELTQPQRDALTAALQKASATAAEDFVAKVRAGMTPDEVAKLDSLTKGKSEADIHRLLGDNIDEARARVRASDEKNETTGGETDPAKVPQEGELQKWQSSKAQSEELDALGRGDATKDQRKHLADELRRQVPDIGLVDAVRAGEAKTVLSVVTPGGGETGIKRMNDELIGYGINSTKLIPERNRIIKQAFEEAGFKVIDQGYKTTTLVTDKPASETGASIKTALDKVDAQMKPLLLRSLQEGIDYYTTDKARRPAGDPEIKIADDRIKKMTALKDKIAATKDFHFDFQLGAAEIKGGKDASYGDILAAEMDSTKAAIMARDPAFKASGAGAVDPRAMIFSQSDFVSFCKETVAIKDKLKDATLPYHGERRRLFDNGQLDRDILRAVRKDSYKEKLSKQDEANLELLKQYFTRVNAFDYVKHFTGDEVGAQGQKVAETAALIKELEGDKPISKESAEKIDKLLGTGIPQADAANEAQFYNRTAKLDKRTVLNADIKDMGLDLFEGYASTMDAVGRGKTKDLAEASRSASDRIVEYKRNAAAEFERFYKEELLPEARAKAKAAQRDDLLTALDHEGNPLMLLGGDEVTVSLHGAFEELGLLPKAVAKLTDPKVANARVAVTHTGSGDGAQVHADAMKKGQGGQDMLKKTFEPLARDLDAKAAGLPPTKAARARSLVERINRMYTSEVGGKTEVLDSNGKVVDVEALKLEAQALLKGSD